MVVVHWKSMNTANLCLVAGKVNWNEKVNKFNNFNSSSYVNSFLNQLCTFNSKLCKLIQIMKQQNITKHKHKYAISFVSLPVTKHIKSFLTMKMLQTQVIHECNIRQGQTLN